jgi:Acyl-CoA dehydrogenase, C-terminal domain
MEAVSDLCQSLADKKGYDIRLEAAAAKEWNTVKAWRIVDETMQIRGGRGYERESSLAARGEAPVGVERAMRDARINLIFEGSSEIMHLFMAREAVDRHLQISGALIDPKVPAGKKLAMLPKVGWFYATWYLGLWARGLFAPRFGHFGRLGRHLRFVERSSRKLAREIFHAMMVFRAAAERKQAYLFRVVDIANELFAMSASVSRAEALRAAGGPDAAHAQQLADHFCLASRRRVEDLFDALWSNDDATSYAMGRAVLAGEHAWLEQGGIGLGLEVEDLRPKLPPRAEPRPERVAEPRTAGAAAKADVPA